MNNYVKLNNNNYGNNLSWKKVMEQRLRIFDL